MKTILIITNSLDETVSYIINRFSQIADFFRVDVDRFDQYRFCIDSSWSISNGEREVSEESVHSIYYRKPLLPKIDEYEEQYHSLIQRDIITLINGISDSFHGVVLSKPYILRKCENKVYQILYAHQKGIVMPGSYIGNSNYMCDEYSKKDSIIKPLSTGKTHGIYGWEIYQTNRFDHFNGDVRLTPVYLQDYVCKKYEVRLTIIDGYEYAIRIDTKDKLDWRNDYRNHTYTRISCPDNIRKTCYQMMRDFNLSFGAFDFIVTPDDQWVFLEINPNGQWLWLELSLDLDISEKIVNHLIQ